jgi:CHAD domain-containing protein
MAVKGSREVELKFEAPEATPVPERVGDGLTVETAEELQLVAAYHDTRALRLLRHGATLRHRTGEGEAADGWHLKLPAGVNARHELHVAGDASVVPAELLALVRPHLGRAVPGEVAELRTRRVERAVVDGRGQRVAQLDDDSVVGTRASDGLVVAWRELEVELAPGAPDELLDELGEGLRSSGWEPAAGVAKIGRVLTNGGDPRDLPPSATETKAAAALLAHLDEQVTALVTHEPGARAGDVEAVHKMRVATRRLRSALATFRPCFDREVTDPARDELRWLGGVLGALRDDHVLLQRLEAAVADLPLELVLGPVHEQLRMELTAAAQEHLAELVAALDGDRFLDLMEALHTLVESPPWADAPGGRKVRRRTLRAAARHAIRRVERAVPAHPAAAADAELHELRKAAKRARYALEAIAVTEGGSATEAAARFEAVQELLGDHQDSVGARQLLRRIGAASRGQARNGFTFGLLHEAEHRRADEARAAWPHLAGKATKRKHLRWLKD